MEYLYIAERAADRGYTVVFLAVAVLAATGIFVAQRVRKPAHRLSHIDGNRS